MLKQFLIVSSVCTSLWIGLWVVPALAQSPAPAPAPEASPQSPAPQASPSPAADSSPVSQAEVEKFASAIKQFQTIRQGAQQQATEILAGEELSADRFQQILQTQRDPQAPAPTPAVTSQEQGQFERAISKLEELNQATRAQMTQAVESQGIEPERFSQILAQAQQDAGLRARIEEQLNQ